MATTLPPGQTIQWQSGWYLLIATLFLMVATFFRFWMLGTTPAGLSNDEILNALLTDRLKQGDISLLYDEVQPAREAAFHLILAASTTATGHGVIFLRLPAVWISMLGLAMTLRLARALFGMRTAMIALAFLSFALWPVWLSRSVLHAVLMPFAVSLTLYAIIRSYQSTEFTIASLWFTIGGLSLGIAQYLHSSSWFLIVFVIGFVAYRSLIDQSTFRRHWSNIVYAGALTTVLCVPLLLYIMWHPGTRGISAFAPVADMEALSYLTPSPGMRIADTGNALPTLSIVGLAFCGLVFVGLAVSVTRWKELSYGGIILWLTASLLPYLAYPDQPAAEMLVGTMPALFITAAVGFRAIYTAFEDRFLSRSALYQRAILIAVLLLTVVPGAFITYRRYFVIWPLQAVVQETYNTPLGALAHYLDTTKDTSPVSICTTLVVSDLGPYNLYTDELLRYLVHQETFSVRYFNCIESLVIADDGAPQRIVFPGGYQGQLPRALEGWIAQSQSEDVPGLPANAILHLETETLLAEQIEKFDLTATVTWPPETRRSDRVVLPAHFEGNITLLGYDVRRTIVKAGEPVEVTTYWRVDGETPPRIVQFTHLLSNPVLVLAQRDSLGVSVGTLQRGDIIIQHIIIATPERASEGAYSLSIGLYNPDTFERLEVMEDDQPVANRLFIQPIEITSR